MATRFTPTHPQPAGNDQALFKRAVDCHMQGNFAEAERIYLQLLRQAPRNVDLLYKLALVYSSTGRLLDAHKTIAKVTAAAPDFPEAWNVLGSVLRQRGRPAEALHAFETAIRHRPGYLAAVMNRGAVLVALERFDAAAAAFRSLVEQEAAIPGPYLALADLASDAGRHTEAVAMASQAVHRFGPSPAAMLALGTALSKAQQIGQALDVLCRGSALYPDDAQLARWLAVALLDAADAAGSARVLRRAVRLAPADQTLHSTLLLVDQYVTDDPAVIAAMHDDWVRAHIAPAPAAKARHATKRPGQRLRVGFVSPDLRRHPVGYFVLPFLRHAAQFGIDASCYHVSRTSDDLTQALRAVATNWRDASTLSDDALADRIRNDRIDVLVDLAGHTAHNRLAVFARKPAPVQVSWIGYYQSTRLPQMDAVIMDPGTVTPEAADYFTERVLLADRTRFCYAPPDYAPPVAPPPSVASGIVTFGSFNNIAKLSTATLDHWSAILRAVPESRLLLKWRTLTDPFVRQRIESAFARRGVPADRLDLRGPSAHPQMLAEYGDMDIALDPAPFGGGLTSFEALWQGVPVLTLPGRLPPSRQTAAALSCLGETALIASDPDDLVTKAVQLAQDRDRLTAKRATQRDRMRASPLCDAPAFAANIASFIQSVA